jgi:hypothetical protein
MAAFSAQVGLLGDAVDNGKHFADSSAVGLQAWMTWRRWQSITDIVDALDHAEHGLLTLLGGSFGIIGGACRLRGVAGDFPGRGGHFFHGRGDLIGA